MRHPIHTLLTRFLYPDTTETVAYLQGQLAARLTSRYLVFAAPLNILIHLTVLVQAVFYDAYPLIVYFIDFIRLLVTFVIPVVLIRRGYIVFALTLIFIPGILLLLTQVWFMASADTYALSVFLFLVPALVFRPKLTAIIVVITNSLYLLLIALHPTIREDPLWSSSVIAVLTSVSVFVFVFAEINWIFRRTYMDYVTVERQRQNAELQAQLASERVTIHEQYWELLRSVQHDLRSPSTALMRTVQLLRSGVIPEPKHNQFLYQAEMLSIRVRMRVEALFDDARSRSETIYRIPINLTDVIGHYAPDLQDLIGLEAQHNERQIPTLHIHAPHPLWILGSADQIQRILENVALNSVIAGAQCIHIQLDDTDHSVVLSIQDDGPGFPPTILNGTLQSHRKGGNGLGLLGVQANVRMLDGTIQFLNQSGARIEMRFPRITEHDYA
ncbi:MAG: hypothetical protein HC828_09600 [Blastochloris sp.]|nr:hypothetical protein [Blastochloris sp.]